MVGLSLSAVYNYYLTDNHEQLNALLSLPEQGANFRALLWVSSFCGVAISLSMLSLVMVGGPIMVNIVGTIKDVLLTYAGIAILGGESDCTPLMLVGLAISFAGAAYNLKYKLKMVQ